MGGEIMVSKAKLVIIGIIIIFLVTGCTFIKSPEELVKRPKSTMEENEIYNVIASFLGENKTLTLAVNQRNEEAIRRVDIDGDGNKELFILYKENYGKHQGSEKYGMLFLKKKDNNWYEINRIAGFGYGFDLVEYRDITDDNKPEIFIGSNTENEIDKRVEIYSYHDGFFRSIYNSNYRAFGLDDLDKDGKIEVILFNKKPKSDIKYVEVLKYLGEDIVVVDDYVISNKSYYSTMTVGKASAGEIGIFIDYDIGAYNGYTDLLIMKNNKLTEVLSNAISGYQQKFKGYITGARDINNDGIIEIGFMTKVPVTEEFADYDIPFIKKWYQWNGKNNIVLVQKEYYNYDDGYKIVIPKEWGDSFAILEKRDNRKIEFYSLNSNGEVDKLIFFIKSFKKENWEKEKLVLENRTYTVLKEDRESIVAGIISYGDRKSKYYIDKEKLKEIFYLIQK